MYKMHNQWGLPLFLSFLLFLIFKLLICKLSLKFVQKYGNNVHLIKIFLFEHQIFIFWLVESYVESSMKMKKNKTWEDLQNCARIAVRRGQKHAENCFFVSFMGSAWRQRIHNINLNDHLIYRYWYEEIYYHASSSYFFFIFETSSSGIFYHHNHWALVTLLSLMLTIKIFLEFMYYVSILQTHFFSQKIVYRFIKSSNL